MSFLSLSLPVVPLRNDDSPDPSTEHGLPTDLTYVYPGPLQLPTILSQKQFQTIWSIDEDLRRRTEQWIVKECPIPGKGPQLIDIITSMVRLLPFFNAG